MNSVVRRHGQSRLSRNGEVIRTTKTSRLIRHVWAGIATCFLVFLLWILAAVFWFLTRVNATESLGYVVAANFGIMAWATVLFEIYKPSLSSQWFGSFGFEREGRLYESIGVRQFRWFLQKTRWNRLLGVPAVRNSYAGISTMESGTRLSEASHWLCLVPILIMFCISVGSSRRWMTAAFWIASALLFHIYPIMLQRYHRPRYRRILKHMERTGAENDDSPGLSNRGS